MKDFYFYVQVEMQALINKITQYQKSLKIDSSIADILFSFEIPITNPTYSKVKVYCYFLFSCLAKVFYVNNLAWLCSRKFKHCQKSGQAFVCQTKKTSASENEHKACYSV